MNYVDLKNYVTKIIGLRLSQVVPAFEMLMFNFEGESVSFAIHTLALTRIIKNNDILLTLLDYFSWDRETDENNDEYYNLSKFQTEITGGKVLSVEVTPLNDLTITLDNDVIIQVFISNSYAHFDDEKEQYRIFEVVDEEKENQEDLPSHYVVYGKHIDLE